MKRGDIITVSAPGDYGQPRPAGVVQLDFLDGTDSVLVSLITTLRDAPIYWLRVEPLPDTGLGMISQIMVDKIVALPRRKCGVVIGRIDTRSVAALNGMLSVMLGLAD